MGNRANHGWRRADGNRVGRAAEDDDGVAQLDLAALHQLGAAVRRNGGAVDEHAVSRAKILDLSGDALAPAAHAVGIAGNRGAAAVRARPRRRTHQGNLAVSGRDDGIAQPEAGVVGAPDEHRQAVADAGGLAAIRPDPDRQEQIRSRHLHDALNEDSVRADRDLLTALQDARLDEALAVDEGAVARLEIHDLRAHQARADLEVAPRHQRVGDDDVALRQPANRELAVDVDAPAVGQDEAQAHRPSRTGVAGCIRIVGSVPLRGLERHGRAAVR